MPATAQFVYDFNKTEQGGQKSRFIGQVSGSSVLTP